MKKIISSLAVAFALLIGVTACQKDGGQDEPAGSGSLKMSFGIATPESRATQSNGVAPTTTWSNNVKSLTLLLTQGGTIRDVRTVSFTTAADHLPQDASFANVKSGAYVAYLVANYGETSNPFAAAASIVPSAAVNVALIGTQVDALMLNLTKLTVAPNAATYGALAGENLYTEPAEIFLGYKTGLTINADATTAGGTIDLQRGVALVRVRIAQAPADPANAGKIVAFSDKTSLRIRRHGTGLSVGQAAAATSNPWGVQNMAAGAALNNNVFFSTKAFKTNADFIADRTAGKYSATSDMALGTGTDFTLYNEYLVLPGGKGTANTGSDTKFDFVLTGWAPQDYVTEGGAVVAAGGEMVRWEGAITIGSGELRPNRILELNFTLTSNGRGGTEVTEPGTYGDLNLDVELVDWAGTEAVAVNP